MKIYVAVLADYNSGELTGEWIDLDYLTPHTDTDELNQKINAVLAKSKYPNVAGTLCHACGNTTLNEVSECECGGVILTHYPTAEEWAIHDYDDAYGLGSSLGEHPDLEKLLELNAALEEHGQAAADYYEWLGQWDEEDFNEKYAGEFNSRLDFTYSIVDDLGILNDCPDTLRCYFDYESFGRDLVINDYYEAGSEHGGGNYFHNC